MKNHRDFTSAPRSTACGITTKQTAFENAPQQLDDADTSCRTAYPIAPNRLADTNAPQPSGDADTSSQTASSVAPNRSRFVDALRLRPMISGVPTTRRSCALWRGLMLLLLRRRQPQHRRPSRQELTLPPGCVFAVRYNSR